jgi:hypothetical protein
MALHETTHAVAQQILFFGKTEIQGAPPSPERPRAPAAFAKIGARQ